MAPSDNVEGPYTKIVLFPNGKRYLEYTVVDGVLSGPYAEYYSNGNIALRCEYENDKIHGVHTLYFMGGGVWRKTWFHHGHNMHIDPTVLTEQDKAYMLLSGRVPKKDNT